MNRTITPGDPLTVYDLAAGSGRYAYSSNYDDWKKDQSTVQNLKDFLGHTKAGAAVDIGAEYLVKPQTVNVYGEGDRYYDYDWKIGVSLLDIGYNQYRYGSQSRVFGDPKTNVTDSALDEKFAQHSIRWQASMTACRRSSIHLIPSPADSRYGTRPGW